MSAAQFEKFVFPNLRKMFVPDPGMEFFDVDLDSADLRIVTWESNCQWLKDCFASGRKPYVELMKEYFHDSTKNKNSKEYGQFKSVCHGTNYLGAAAGIAPRVGLLVHEVDKLQKWYFNACPEVPEWQAEVINRINTKRVVSNAWGYKLHIFERPDESVYRECVAWIPQSTVGILINHGFVEIDKHEPDIQVLLQTHDSLSGQYPIAGAADYRKRVVDRCTIPIPYPDPLIVPVGIKVSEKSWGDVK